MPRPADNPARRTRLGMLLDLLLGAVRGRWRRFEIADHSMRPTLNDGDWALGVAQPRRLMVGDVIVCDLPSQPGFEIVKRIASIDPTDGSLWLAGDDPGAGSVDSRSFGAIPAGEVFARVALRYRPLPPSFIR